MPEEVPAGPEPDAPPAHIEEEPPDPKGDKPLTEYLILVKAGNETWSTGPKIKARGASAAIRQHVEKSNADAGTYVAVPTRSWEPVTVATETQTKLVFS